MSSPAGVPQVGAAEIQDPPSTDELLLRIRELETERNEREREREMERKKYEESERVREIERNEREREREIERKKYEESEREREIERKKYEDSEREREIERKKYEESQRALKRYCIEAFISNLAMDRLSIGSKSISKTTTQKLTKVQVGDLQIPEISNEFTLFRQAWNMTVATLGNDSCERAVQTQFRALFESFLRSNHCNKHIVDHSRHGIYGQRQCVDLLFSNGPQSLALPSYYDCCLIGELKSCTGDTAKKQKAAFGQVLQRMAHAVRECGVDRRKYCGFACDHETVQFIVLSITGADDNMTWSASVEHTDGIELNDAGQEWLCRMVCADPQWLCQWLDEPHGGISTFVSSLLSEVNDFVCQPIRMLQRSPGNAGTAAYRTAEVAQCRSADDVPTVVKCFHPDQGQCFEYELQNLDTLATLMPPGSVAWCGSLVPKVVYRCSTDRGSFIATQPCGSPVPLASLARQGVSPIDLCIDVLLQLTAINLCAHGQKLHHMDICDQNIVAIADSPFDGFGTSICLIDWGGASNRTHGKSTFHLHVAFSPEWLFNLTEADVKNLSDTRRLIACMQQTLLTVFHLAFADRISWLNHFVVRPDGTQMRIMDQQDMIQGRATLLQWALGDGSEIAHQENLESDWPASHTTRRELFRALRDRLGFLFCMETVPEAGDEIVKSLYEQVASACNTVATGRSVPLDYLQWLVSTAQDARP